MGDAEDIIAAVQKNDVAAVRELLAKDANLVLTKTPAGSLLQRFPQLTVYEASAVGDAQRLRHLLEEQPEKVNVPNQQGFTPLGLSAFFGHKAAVQVLLARGAEVDLIDSSRFANTPLDAAVAANHLEIVQVLLTAHASVNVRSAGGYSPLHKAAQNGNWDLVKLLLDHKADPQATDDAGKTPLDYAVEKGHASVAELLRHPPAAP